MPRKWKLYLKKLVKYIFVAIGIIFFVAVYTVLPFPFVGRFLLWLFVMFCLYKIIVRKKPKCEVCGKLYRPFVPIPPVRNRWIKVAIGKPEWSIFGYICPSKECYQKYFSELKPKLTAKQQIGPAFIRVCWLFLYFFLTYGILSGELFRMFIPPAIP